MIRCYRCNVVLTEPDAMGCGGSDLDSCRRRAERRNMMTQAADNLAALLLAQKGTDWKAICIDYVGQLQLIASHPALQKLADEGLGEDAAALRKIMALLREGPQPTGRK